MKFSIPKGRIDFPISPLLGPLHWLVILEARGRSILIPNHSGLSREDSAMWRKFEFSSFPLFHCLYVTLFHFLTEEHGLRDALEAFRGLYTRSGRFSTGTIRFFGRMAESISTHQQKRVIRLSG